MSIVVRIINSIKFYSCLFYVEYLITDIRNLNWSVDFGLQYLNNQHSSFILISNKNSVLTLINFKKMSRFMVQQKQRMSKCLFWWEAISCNVNQIETPMSYTVCILFLVHQYGINHPNISNKLKHL